MSIATAMQDLGQNSSVQYKRQQERLELEKLEMKRYFAEQAKQNPRLVKKRERLEPLANISPREASFVSNRTTHPPQRLESSTSPPPNLLERNAHNPFVYPQPQIPFQSGLSMPYMNSYQVVPPITYSYPYQPAFQQPNHFPFMQPVMAYSNPSQMPFPTFNTSMPTMRINQTNSTMPINQSNGYLHTTEDSPIFKDLKAEEKSEPVYFSRVNNGRDARMKKEEYAAELKRQMKEANEKKANEKALKLADVVVDNQSPDSLPTRPRRKLGNVENRQTQLQYLKDLDEQVRIKKEKEREENQLRNTPQTQQPFEPAPPEIPFETSQYAGRRMYSNLHINSGSNILSPKSTQKPKLPAISLQPASNFFPPSINTHTGAETGDGELRNSYPMSYQPIPQNHLLLDNMNQPPYQNSSPMNFNAPNLYSSTSNPHTNSFPPNPDPKSFLKGVKNVENLTPWEIEKLAQRHKAQVEVQEALKKQIADKEEHKRLSIMRKKLDDEKEQAALENERKKLAEKYAKEKEDARIKEEENRLENERQVALKLNLQLNSSQALKSKEKVVVEEEFNQAPKNHVIPEFRSDSPPIPTVLNRIKKVNNEVSVSPEQNGASISKDTKPAPEANKNLATMTNSNQNPVAHSPPIPTIQKRMSQEKENLKVKTVEQNPEAEISARSKDQIWPPDEDVDDSLESRKTSQESLITQDSSIRQSKNSVANEYNSKEDVADNRSPSLSGDLMLSNSILDHANTSRSRNSSGRQLGLSLKTRSSKSDIMLNEPKQTSKPASRPFLTDNNRQVLDQLTRIQRELESESVVLNNDFENIIQATPDVFDQFFGNTPISITSEPNSSVWDTTTFNNIKVEESELKHSISTNNFFKQKSFDIDEIERVNNQRLLELNLIEQPLSDDEKLGRFLKNVTTV